MRGGVGTIGQSLVGLGVRGWGDKSNQTSSSTQTSVAYTGYSSSTAKSQGYRYQYGTGRLLGTPKFGQIDTIKYDASGNEIFHKDEPPNAEAASYHRDRASYYSADGQLRAAETRYIGTGDVQTAAIHTRVFEEFRYDALGRRILSRSRNWCEKDPDDWEGLCRQSKLRRMVWDGDEELYEIQMPGGDSSSYLENDTAQVVLPSFTEDLAIRVDPNRFYGRVAYTHALGIDQPVAITRVNYADRVNDNFDEVPFMARAPFMVSPLWNERGQMYSGTYVDGETLSCQPESGVGADTVPRCIHFGSAASWFAYVRDRHKRSAWHGSLVEDRAEQSGILYRRNRYYDPEKGKFTQEDPIGLAGGVNLYGFAAGDPVNLGDPFGLRVCFRGNAPEIRELKRATESATGTSITLHENCVERAVAKKNSRGFEAIQAGFAALVSSSAVYTVSFTRGYSVYDPGTRSVRLSETWDAHGYPVMAGGQCSARASYVQPGQILAHELAHAYHVGHLGKSHATSPQRRREELQAMIWENTYNAIYGLRGRCDY